MGIARNKTALWAALERWLPRLEVLANEQGVAKEKILEEALEQVCAKNGFDFRLMLDRMIDEAEQSGSEGIGDLPAWQAGREDALRKRLDNAAV